MNSWGSEGRGEVVLREKVSHDQRLWSDIQNRLKEEMGRDLQSRYRRIPEKVKYRTWLGREEFEQFRRCMGSGEGLHLEEREKNHTVGSFNGTREHGREGGEKRINKRINQFGVKGRRETERIWEKERKVLCAGENCEFTSMEIASRGLK